MSRRPTRRTRCPGSRDESGAVLGIFVQNTDGVTAQVLNDRRLRTCANWVGADRGRAACDRRRPQDLRVLAGNRADVPFGSIYLIDGSGEPQLVDHFGFRPGALLPPREGGTEPVALTRLRRTAANGGAVVDHRDAGQFPDFYDPTGALDDAEPDSSLMLPLVEHGRSEPLGVLVLGMQPAPTIRCGLSRLLHLVADHARSWSPTPSPSRPSGQGRGTGRDRRREDQVLPEHQP